MAFSAPRILNEPIGWRFSSFSQSSNGVSTSRRTSGVRIAALAIRRRAASISAALGALSVGMAGSAELDDRTSRSFDGERVHVLRRRDVLDGEPERLEESDLGAGPASRVGSSDDLAELGDD